MIALTTQQSRLLSHLESYISRSGGVAPTFDEMKAEIGLASKSSVSRLLDALEERGRIRRFPQRARAIEIVDLGPLHGRATADLRAELARRGITILQADQEVAQTVRADGRP